MEFPHCHDIVNDDCRQQRQQDTDRERTLFATKEWQTRQPRKRGAQDAHRCNHQQTFMRSGATPQQDARPSQNRECHCATEVAPDHAGEELNDRPADTDPEHTCIGIQTDPTCDHTSDHL